MRYISSKLLDDSAITSDKLPLLRSSHLRRSEELVEINDDFADSIDCRLISPIILNEESRVNVISTLILRLGFKVKLPLDASVIWIRFQAEVAGRNDSNRSFEKMNICSFIPQRVIQDLVLGGHLIEHDDGTLSRDQNSIDDTGPSGTTFERYSLGYKINPSHIIWDFLPVEGRSPYNTDKLILSINFKAQIELQLSQSLQIRVTHQMFGTESFEFPLESRIIKTTI